MKEYLDRAIKYYIINGLNYIIRCHIVLFLASITIVLSKIVISGYSLDYTLSKISSEGLVPFYPVLFNFFALFKFCVAVSPIFLGFMILVFPLFIISKINKSKKLQELSSYLIYCFFTISLACDTFDFWIYLFFGKNN